MLTIISANKLNEAETKLNGKLREVQRNVSGINSNLENLLPIIKDMNSKFKTLQGSKEKARS